MPSPVGHAIGGLIAGWAIVGAPALERAHRPRPAALLRAAAPFALIAAAPDLDLLVGLHSRYTHSLGAAALVALTAYAITWRARRPHAARFALACGLACASHTLLDWLGSDTSPPLGIMALWPWSSDFYQADLNLFLATDRRYWLPGFIARNLHALAWELIILLPILAIVWWRRRPRQPAGTQDATRAVRRDRQQGRTAAGKREGGRGGKRFARTRPKPARAKRL